nr:MAG TPA: hemolysin [Herelleviridae sp.]
MTNDYERLEEQVNLIKNQIQEKGFIDKESYSELEKELVELRKIIASIDKEQAVSSEKQGTVYIQLERLDEKIKELAESAKDKDSKKKETTEKVLLLVLGAILSFIFNKF